MKNCRIWFLYENGKMEHEDFFDPYIFDINDIPHMWNGNEWNRCTSYGGKAIEGTLKKVFPKNINDPPPGFKRDK